MKGETSANSDYNYLRAVRAANAAMRDGDDVATGVNQSSVASNCMGSGLTKGPTL